MYDWRYTHEMKGVCCLMFFAKVFRMGSPRDNVAVSSFFSRHDMAPIERQKLTHCAPRALALAVAPSTGAFTDGWVVTARLVVQSPSGSAAKLAARQTLVSAMSRRRYVWNAATFEYVDWMPDGRLLSDFSGLHLVLARHVMSSFATPTR